MLYYEGHTVLLEAIAEVREELKRVGADGKSSIEVTRVLTRLVTLYACLNVDELKQIVRNMEGLELNNVVDIRKYADKKKAA